MLPYLLLAYASVSRTQWCCRACPSAVQQILPSWCMRETLWYYGVVIVNQVVRSGRALDGSENGATSKPEARLSVLLEPEVHSSQVAHAILAKKMPVAS
jgi:hypothetical protein